MSNCRIYFTFFFIILTSIICFHPAFAQTPQVTVEIQAPETNLTIDQPFDGKARVKCSGGLNAYVLVIRQVEGHAEDVSASTYNFSDEEFPEPYEIDMPTFYMDDTGNMIIGGTSFGSKGIYYYTIEVYDADKVRQQFGQIPTSGSPDVVNKLQGIRHSFTPLASQKLTIVVK